MSRCRCASRSLLLLQNGRNAEHRRDQHAAQNHTEKQRSKGDVTCGSALGISVLPVVALPLLSFANSRPSLFTCRYRPAARPLLTCRKMSAAILLVTGFVRLRWAHCGRSFPSADRPELSAAGTPNWTNRSFAVDESPRLSPSPRLYSADPRSSQWPSTLTRGIGEVVEDSLQSVRASASSAAAARPRGTS